MYPSICLHCNCSSDKLKYIDESEVINEIGQTLRDGTWWVVDKKHAIANIGGHYSYTSPGAVSEYVSKMTELRKKVGKKSYTGWALKVLTTSLYGAMGSETSLLASPRLSSLIPLVGRTYSAIIAIGFRACGMKQIYGDTDSGFFAKIGGEVVTPNELWLVQSGARTWS